MTAPIVEIGANAVKAFQEFEQSFIHLHAFIDLWEKLHAEGFTAEQIWAMTPVEMHERLSRERDHS